MALPVACPPGAGTGLDDATLLRLADRLLGCTEPRTAARLLLDVALSASDAPRGVVLGGPEGQLALLVEHGLGASGPGTSGPGTSRPAASPAVARAYRTATAQAVSQPDAEVEPWLTRLLPAADALLVVPLQAGRRSGGALVLELDDVPVEAVDALQTAATLTAGALRTGWAFEQVQRLAATDGLTKIANRRTFETTLEREVARATRADEHLSLVMIDIDHFKRLNDTHGHPVGDEVLRNVALALACECRDFDTAARYGGEEFAVVLPGCGPAEALEIAERLRRAVSAAPSTVTVTASAGVATFPGHGPDADALVRAADAALYCSKHAGRDRTTVAQDTAPAEAAAAAQAEALLRRVVARQLGREPAVPVVPASRPSRS